VEEGARTSKLTKAVKPSIKDIAENQREGWEDNTLSKAQGCTALSTCFAAVADEQNWQVLPGPNDAKWNNHKNYCTG